MASRALVIGPSEYAESSGIPGHPTILASAEMYGKVLADDGMWGPERCRVLSAKEVRTVGGVMDALHEEAAATEEADILLVVYVGHGRYWSDIPGSQVHFSVGSSYKDKPWTWLSSWYLYRAMRQARAGLKVLIADCCYSNMLPTLGGDEDGKVLPGVLGRREKGSCVFTAVKDVEAADAEGCASLPDALRECTPFSGHLLHVLRDGTTDPKDRLTIGLLREAVKLKMTEHDHNRPGMLLNDASENIPLFTNRKHRLHRDRSRVPSDVEDWIKHLMLDQDYLLDELFRNEEMVGDVVGRLSRRKDEASQRLAGHLDEQADQRFKKPNTFARYWNRVEQARRA
ncbi:hypothetical protein DN069_15670 [Streptacidiphilus pinicola]|uniref:Caspase family protein n=1 Tax=Streptacidiphilus pinicola TaxID=2219663 RepID=A0A2X0J312_9ACTN|nr:hypothetical protein [Streptacidiphilus pinicola]RAG84616.1 hypothetical protein DN069_15670 [Streptacidiphilus pinicola]